MRFDGRVALVTGAGSGIGRATALLLAQQGCLVGALDIDSAASDALAPELKAIAERCFASCGDIAEASSVQEFVGKAARTFGRIDFLFNNAGLELVAPLEETTEEQWERVHDTNLKGTFLMTREVLPHMRALGGGAVVNNSSDAGLRGIKLNAAYSSSKAGVIHLTRSVALDYGKYNIRCNCICPGCIQTPLCRRFNEEVGLRKGQTAEKTLNDFVQAKIPLKRVGYPEEVAQLVAFLFSDEAAYLSGAVIPIDGGLTAGM
jgi:NAD(P)-dependent dehydrogenase (short-subunit alcohol dehydrogenase family)